MKKSVKIAYVFRGVERLQEFFFGLKKGDNGFSLKDERGIIHDCILNGNVVKVYGQDSDYLEETSYAKVV